MNLDERLSAASKRRSSAVDDHIKTTGLDNWNPARNDPATPPRASTGYYWLAAAAVLIFGAVVLSQRPDRTTSGVDLISPTETVAPTTAAVAEEDLPVTTVGPTSEPTNSVAPSTTLLDEAEPGEKSDEAEDSTTKPSTPNQTEATTTASDSASSSIAPETVNTAAGVPNNVCGTGYRAELERASLTNIGETLGWGAGGPSNLTDEQNALHYVRPWEHNFDGPVTAEITLEQPVLATEIRLAQDPINPVSGTIELTVGPRDQEQRFDVALSGMDGWRSHQFGSPTYLERITITRRTSLANITEVIICTASP